MFIRPIFLLLFLLLTLIPAAHSAPVDDWNALIVAGSKQKFEGKYDVASQYFAKAVAFAQKEKLPDKYLPISLCRLAEAQLNANQVTEADSHFNQITNLIKDQKANNKLDSQVNFWAAALADAYLGNHKPDTRELCLKHGCYLKALAYGSNHDQCTSCLLKLVDYYVENENIDQAVNYLTMIDKIKKQKPDYDPDWLGNKLNELAIACVKKSAFTKTRQLELTVIKMTKTSRGNLSLGLPAFYSLLGISEIAQRHETKGKEYFQIAISECPKIERSKKVLAMPHAMEYVELFHGVIGTYCDQKKFSLAETTARQTLALRKAITKDPRWQCGTLQFLSGVMYDEGKFDEYEKYADQAITIAKLPHCYANPQVPNECLWFAQKLASHGKMDKANKAFADAIQAEKDAGGFHSTLVLFWGGKSLKDHGQANRASEKWNLAFKQAHVLALEKRGTLLADLLQMAGNDKRDHGQIRQAQIYWQKSEEEIQRQKKIKTKLGPDIFKRLQF